MFPELFRPTEIRIAQPEASDIKNGAEMPPPHDCQDVDEAAVPTEVVDLDEVYSPFPGLEE